VATNILGFRIGLGENIDENAFFRVIDFVCSILKSDEMVAFIFIDRVKASALLELLIPSAI
jgi:hypothetical protein